MAITLGAVALPSGLIWGNEFDWHPVAQATEYSLTGALILEQSIKQAGRLITLTGGKDFAWLTRAQVKALKAALDSGAVLTLTLHDARTFSVVPAAEPLAVSPLPRVLDSGLADAGDGAWCVLESLSLIGV
jgi:hypothetical protein